MKGFFLDVFSACIDAKAMRAGVTSSAINTFDKKNQNKQ
jgi:hypothetical protein